MLVADGAADVVELGGPDEVEPVAAETETDAESAAPGWLDPVHAASSAVPTTMGTRVARRVTVIGPHGRKRRFRSYLVDDPMSYCHRCQVGADLTATPCQRCQ